MSRDLGLATHDDSEPHTIRNGDNCEYRAEPVAGITTKLGLLPPESRVLGWLMGLEWWQAADIWRDADIVALPDARR